jgi:hypothetical protein
MPLGVYRYGGPKMVMNNIEAESEYSRMATYLELNRPLYVVPGEKRNPPLNSSEFFKDNKLQNLNVNI